MSIKDSCLGSGSLHPSFLGLGRVVKGKVSEKNGSLPCPNNPKNLNVEQLTLNTNSNTLRILRIRV